MPVCHGVMLIGQAHVEQMRLRLLDSETECNALASACDVLAEQVRDLEGALRTARARAEAAESTVRLAQESAARAWCVAFDPSGPRTKTSPGTVASSAAIRSRHRR